MSVCPVGAQFFFFPMRIDGQADMTKIVALPSFETRLKTTSNLFPVAERYGKLVQTALTSTSPGRQCLCEI